VAPSAQFVALCRRVGLLTKPSVVIDGSKFKAVNNRDNNSRAPRESAGWAGTGTTDRPELQSPQIKEGPI
jgi:hypothetical protein